jgi:hypothetical protein
MPYTDSAPVVAVLDAQGAWLHDPLAPQATALNLRHGRSMRGASLDVEQQATRYAGRTYPVADYGQGESETVDVRANVPFGPGHAATLARLRALARLRRPLMYRDSRGRAMVGSVLNLRAQDTHAGADVSFVVDRRDA